MLAAGEAGTLLSASVLLAVRRIGGWKKYFLNLRTCLGSSSPGDDFH